MLFLTRTFRHFRNVYKDTLIEMVNDGGDPGIEIIAKQYHAQYRLETRSSSNTALFFNSSAAATSLVERILSTALSSNADWVLLLEDDVHIVKEISLDSLQHDLIGDYPRTHLPDHIIEVVERHKGSELLDAHYGCCGGCILRGRFLRRLLKHSSWRQRIEELCTLESPIASDVMWSSLVLMNDGSIGSYPGFAEKWYPDYEERLQKGTIEVLHQEKSFY